MEPSRHKISAKYPAAIIYNSLTCVDEFTPGYIRKSRLFFVKNILNGTRENY